MKKNYLVPISFILISQCFSEEIQQLEQKTSQPVRKVELSQYRMTPSLSETKQASQAHQLTEPKLEAPSLATQIQNSDAIEEPLFQNAMTPPSLIAEYSSTTQAALTSQQPEEAQPAVFYNTPVRPIVQNGINLWFKGEALVFQAVEENLTYAYKGFNSASRIERDFKTVHFNWDWGFRLGTGYNTPYDGWDIKLDWMRINNTARGKVKAGGSHEALFELFVNAANVNDTGTDFHAHWHTLLNQIDLNLGREFLVGKYLAIRPNAGLRSAWINQKYRIDYDFSAGSDQDVDLKNRFFGFGFVGGIDSDWRLGAGFSLFGNADLSILFGFFDIDEKAKAAGSTLWEVSNSFRTGRAIFDIALGIKWCRTFWDERVGFTFKAGYEYHHYFDQNQFLLSNGNSAFELFNPVTGDLTYQGVSLSAQIDF
ncbi:MAG: hypothetical protein K2P51_08565 [Rhabdochlamydiaceae bacterium]|nr:hypothetical protein [Rhabdochlamydiaceae bacterium]